MDSINDDIATPQMPTRIRRRHRYDDDAMLDGSEDAVSAVARGRATRTNTSAHTILC